MKQIQVPAPLILSYKTVDQWEIDPAPYNFWKRLGSGQSMEVWEGLWNNTTPVAVNIKARYENQNGILIFITYLPL